MSQLHCEFGIKSAIYDIVNIGCIVVNSIVNVIFPRIKINHDSMSRHNITVAINAKMFALQTT